jgi:hypothetical protein
VKKTPVNTALLDALTRPLGRPIVLTPCPWCKKEFASREFRKHVVKCGWRVKRRRRAAGLASGG